LEVEKFGEWKPNGKKFSLSLPFVESEGLGAGERAVKSRLLQEAGVVKILATASTPGEIHCLFL